MIRDASAHEIADELLDALRAGRGLSCIRMGDGEGRLLMWPRHISKEMMGRHLRYWFGRSDFHSAEIRIMRDMLVRAVALSDIVCYRKGAPQPFWRYPETWMAQHCDHDVLTHDNDLHIHLWEAGLLDEIVLASKGAILVTCRDVFKAFAERYGKPTAWVRVPEEGHTGGRPTDHFSRSGEIMCEAARQCGEGVLVLVGAGCLGKWYAAMCGRSGAVALDIGSLFDLWAQIPSRSWVAEALTKDPNRGTLVAEEEADSRAM